MIWRILSSIAWKIWSVTSMRVPGGRADMELDHAAVDRRVEIAADKVNITAPSARTSTAKIGTIARRVSRISSSTDISLAQMLEAALEGRHGSGRRIRCRRFRAAAALACWPFSSRPMVIGVSVRDRP